MEALSQLLQPGLLIPVVAILMPIAIVLIALTFAHKFQERKHETIVNLLEKGLPVPVELLRPTRREGSPFMRAMTLIGIGVGVTAFLSAMFGLDHGLWACGLIPLAIGVAQLIALKLEPARPEAAPPPSSIDLQ
jgi:hypothetical protein